MTSGIPDYANQPAFEATLFGGPVRPFRHRPTGVRMSPPFPSAAGYNYSNTDYILAQMIIEQVTHDSYASQLTRRIIDPRAALHVPGALHLPCPTQPDA